MKDTKERYKSAQTQFHSVKILFYILIMYIYIAPIFNIKTIVNTPIFFFIIKIIFLDINNFVNNSFFVWRKIVIDISFFQCYWGFQLFRFPEDRRID